MKIKICFSIIVISLFFYLNYSFAQSRRAVWRMGYWQSGPIFQMDFHGGVLQIDSLNVPHPMSMYIEDAGICSPQGNLLFYTNGIYIANATHDTMLNGNDLNPGQITTSWRDFGLFIFQGAIALPDPADSNQYYLFYSTLNPVTFGADSILMAKIDMSLDGGLGAVTNKNVLLSNLGFVAGQFTAVKHANGRDWWLICHGYNNDNYCTFFISSSGISGPFTQHIGLPIQYPGQACISPDGSLYSSYENNNDLDILNFDRCSGVFSNYRHIVIPDTSVSLGCAFSPNSQVLYVSSKLYLYQFNVTANDIYSTMDTVAIFDGFGDPNGTSFVMQELAPDNKIYITGFGSVRHLSVINYPDSLGLACGVTQHSISLPGSNNGSLPNYPFYELGALSGSICDSLPTSVEPLISKLDQVFIFPNPSTKDLYLRNGSNEITEIKVYNSLGQILTIEGEVIRDMYLHWDISSLESGIYIMKINTKTETFHRKFVRE